MNAELLVTPRSKTSRRANCESGELAVFPTALGWIALSTREESLVRLVFGYRSARAAREALATASKANPLAAAQRTSIGQWTAAVQDRLEAFAEGHADDFADIRVWSEGWTPFRRRVLDCCRQIPYGRTRTYTELAIAAGSPGSARAVGRAMATNPIPLVIPCHRVLGSGGNLCGFSAVGGLDAKRRLLAIEGAAVSQ